ncbi:hypothetical protein AB0876_03835 [Mycobacterium sp. NPDC049093]
MPHKNYRRFVRYPSIKAKAGRHTWEKGGERLMPWFYVDDGFSDSKPVMDMPARHRLAACGLWVLAGSWSAKEETDGLVPDSKLKQLGARDSLIETLTGFGPMSAPLWDQVEGGVQFKSWSKWQRTRAELIEKRREAAERQRQSRSRKVKGRNAVSSNDDELSQCDSHVTDIESDAPVTGAVTRDPHAHARRPDPTRPDPSSLVDLSGGVTQVAATGPRPQCHEHTENYDGPCRKCKRRRQWDEANKGVVAAAEVDRKRALKALRENCPRCHGTNTYEDETGVHTCNPHVEAVRHA